MKNVVIVVLGLLLAINGTMNIIANAKNRGLKKQTKIEAAIIEAASKSTAEMREKLEGHGLPPGTEGYRFGVMLPDEATLSVSIAYMKKHVNYAQRILLSKVITSSIYDIKKEDWDKLATVGSGSGLADYTIIKREPNLPD